MTAGERVRHVRLDAHMTMEKFGEQVGVTKMTISRIENGVNALTPQMARAISMAFGVSEDWLRTGEGEMRTVTGNEMVAEVAARLHLSEWGTQAFERFCRLDSHERAEFLRLAEQVFAPLPEDDKTEAIIRAAGEAAMEAKRAELLDEKREADA